jgi:TetR/AcrR family transcriptional repressor of nem operon
MPWPKEHKRNTRKRIVETAAAAFRQAGIAQVGVADVMQRAGLTHGGFYAHFASKDDLLAEALPYASAQVTSMLETSLQEAPSTHRLLQAAMTYLSSFHLAHPERGCPVASLAPELMRGDEKIRRELAAEIRKRLKQLHDLTPAQLPLEVRRRQVAGAFGIRGSGISQGVSQLFARCADQFQPEAHHSKAPPEARLGRQSSHSHCLNAAVCS